MCLWSGCLSSYAHNEAALLKLSPPTHYNGFIGGEQVLPSFANFCVVQLNWSLILMYPSLKGTKDFLFFLFFYRHHSSALKYEIKGFEWLESAISECFCIATKEETETVLCSQAILPHLCFYFSIPVFNICLTSNVAYFEPLQHDFYFVSPLFYLFSSL